MFISVSEVLKLLVLQEWEILRTVIFSSPSFFCNIASAISACSDFNGMTILHATVRYNPPLDIVAEMIRLCPDMPAVKDCLNRTPLHVAAGSKAPASLLKLIASACPAACNVQDEQEKTPLHFACDSACVLFEEDHRNNAYKENIPNHECIAALLSYSLSAATLEDEEEMTPLEHAIISGASMKTVKLLQAATSQGMQVGGGSEMKQVRGDITLSKSNSFLMPERRRRKVSLEMDDFQD